MAADIPLTKNIPLDKSKYILLILLLTICRLSSQNVADTIKKTAIDCSGLTVPNDKLYSALKDFKCICIGEMHGTKEPAEFLVYLTKLFTDKKRKVIVGIEIPKGSMTKFIERPDSIGLTESGFFSNKGGDGRNSEAWFKAINECNKLKVQFCFLDGYPDNYKYDNLMECYKADTNAVILTLTGNVHNKLLPYKDIKQMACYLKDRFGNKVFSINHIYNGGTMYNLTSDGLKVHTSAPTNGIFSTSTNYSNYFLLNIFNTGRDYSAYYYTKVVTASLPFKK